MQIIAESAFNHNGSLSYLKKLAKASKKAGANYFTVQVLDPASFCVENYDKYKIYKENAFTEDEWESLFQHCEEIGIDLIPCALEEKSFEFCYNYGFRKFKIHATDIVNEPFLRKIKKKQDCEILLETQCSTLFDINFSLSIIGENVEAIFHGFSNYPTEVEDLNLDAIDHLREEFPNYKIGFADHSLDTSEIPLMALAKNTDYLEKHITLSRNDRNFDWQVSLYPSEFGSMVQKLRHYGKAIGENGWKHPTTSEMNYRDIIHKKVLDNESILKRSDKGSDYLTEKFSSFSRNSIGIAIIARLKSKRLPKKVLKKIGNNKLLVNLYDRLKNAQKISELSIATSYLKQDDGIEAITEKNDMNCFRGHPKSVIDRMLSFAFQKEIGGVFRVTGDNPFTDPYLIDQMCSIFLENEVDYVRANNVPFGISAELFSTKYLWQLYLKLNNPKYSEYLSWFVLNDDNCKKACIDFTSEHSKVKFVNLSVDYEEDYKRVVSLYKDIGKKEFSSIEFSDIIRNIDLTDTKNPDELIKLPDGETISFKKYLNLIDSKEYTIRKKIEI